MWLRKNKCNLYMYNIQHTCLSEWSITLHPDTLPTTYIGTCCIGMFCTTCKDMDSYFSSQHIAGTLPCHKWTASLQHDFLFRENVFLLTSIHYVLLLQTLKSKCFGRVTFQLNLRAKLIHCKHNHMNLFIQNWNTIRLLQFWNLRKHTASKQYSIVLTTYNFQGTMLTIVYTSDYSIIPKKPHEPEFLARH